MPKDLRRRWRQWTQPASIPLVPPASSSEADNFKAVLRGLIGVTCSGAIGRRLGGHPQTLSGMAYGLRPVSMRRVYLLRDNFSEYRRLRLQELAKVREDFERMMEEEHALLEWSRHHLDELIRRFQARGPAVLKPRQKLPR